MIEGALLKLSYDIAKDIYKAGIRAPKIDSDEIQRNIQVYIEHLNDWSKSIQAIGMSGNHHIDDASIKIGINSTPRKFSFAEHPQQLYDEDSILLTDNSVVVLGDPGSGKTTLIKRIVRNISFSPPTHISNLYKAPIVVFGRDLSANHTILDDIYTSLGFDINQSSKSTRQNDEPEKKDRANLRYALRKSIHQKDFVILIDGIDEVSQDYRQKVFSDLLALRRIAPSTKIIVTSRPGEWSRQINGFDIFQMNPLSEEDIEEVVSIWAQNPKDCLTAMKQSPYKDALDRPLILTMLVVLFNSDGSLPESPIDVYDRIVRLFLEQWDKAQGLKRSSRFGEFPREKKLRFLKSLAFHMLFLVKSKRFSEKDAAHILPYLRADIKISQENILEVLKEIESHTGIIIEYANEKFEFAHLTIQEYLAADYLSGIPFQDNLDDLLATSPATIAVATSISSEPENFLAAVFDEFASTLRERGNEQETLARLISYLERYSLEAPSLKPSHHLALALLSLFDTFRITQVAKHDEHVGEICSHLSKILSKKELRNSFMMIHKLYSCHEALFNMTELRLSRGIKFKTFIRYPKQVSLNARVIWMLKSIGLDVFFDLQ